MSQGMSWHVWEIQFGPQEMLQLAFSMAKICGHSMVPYRTYIAEVPRFRSNSRMEKVTSHAPAGANPITKGKLQALSPK